jgi:hypothetical protein
MASLCGAGCPLGGNTAAAIRTAGLAAAGIDVVEELARCLLCCERNPPVYHFVLARFRHRRWPTAGLFRREATQASPREAMTGPHPATIHPHLHGKGALHHPCPSPPRSCKARPTHVSLPPPPPSPLPRLWLVVVLPDGARVCVRWWHLRDVSMDVVDIDAGFTRGSTPSPNQTVTLCHPHSSSTLRRCVSSSVSRSDAA